MPSFGLVAAVREAGDHAAQNPAIASRGQARREEEKSTGEVEPYRRHVLPAPPACPLAGQEAGASEQCAQGARQRRIHTEHLVERGAQPGGRAQVVVLRVLAALSTVPPRAGCSAIGAVLRRILHAHPDRPRTWTVCYGNVPGSPGPSGALVLPFAGISPAGVTGFEPRAARSSRSFRSSLILT